MFLKYKINKNFNSEEFDNCNIDRRPNTCNICFKTDNTVIYCKGCLLPVHNSCYGAFVNLNNFFFMILAKGMTM